jgi:hypothetical protein
MQAALAFSPADSAQNNIDKIIAHYNTFALNPSSEAFPAALPADSIKIFKDYFVKNKIEGPLPEATLTKKGIIELRIKNLEMVMEINPVLGTIRLNGETLVLKSTDSIQNRLEQIEIFLSTPKTASSSEKFISFFIQSANADCLSKYDAAIAAKMPKRNGFFKLPHPGAWTLGALLVISLLLIPTPWAMLPMYSTLVFVPGVNDIDRDIRSAEGSVERKNHDLILIDSALRIAKSGKVPFAVSEMKRPYNEDEWRFEGLYAFFTEESIKIGRPLLSKEDFLKTIAEGDLKEKFCKLNITENAEIFFTQMTMQASVDPNEINKTIDPMTSIVDEAIKNIPKDVTKEEIDKKMEPISALPK